jgi:hypothetical protein
MIAPVTLKLDGGAQPTSNGVVDTGTDNILSLQALFGLLNATKDGKILPHEFRAGKEAWNAIYDLFDSVSFTGPYQFPQRKPKTDEEMEHWELLFAGIPIKYDSLVPTDTIQAWRIGIMHDTQLGQLCGVTR